MPRTSARHSAIRRRMARISVVGRPALLHLGGGRQHLLGRAKDHYEVARLDPQRTLGADVEAAALPPDSQQARAVRRQQAGVIERAAIEARLAADHELFDADVRAALQAV